MTKQTKKHNNTWQILMGIAGGILLFWSVSIGDVRSQMSKEQAKTELPSKKNTFALGAGGVALIALSALTRKKERE